MKSNPCVDIFCNTSIFPCRDIVYVISKYGVAEASSRFSSESVFILGNPSVRVRVNHGKDICVRCPYDSREDLWILSV